MLHLEYPGIPFHALLQRAADRWPNKTAMTFQDRRVSFDEWNREANQFAQALLDLGLHTGDRIGIYMPNCPEYEVAFFGSTRAGAVPTPLNPAYKEREAKQQLADSGASLVAVHASLYPVISAVRSELPELHHVIVIGDAAAEDALSFDALLAGQPDTQPEVELSPADLATLPYSSGTTGLSKGVMLTHSNLVHNALQFVETTASTDDDTLLIFLPLYHIYGVALMATAVASGACQVLMERFDLADVVRLIQVEQITELYVAPPVMLALANAPDLAPEQFESLRFVMSAAAPLGADVARRVADRLHVRVIQAYGMTETSPLTHMVPLDLDEDTYQSVGVPAPDTECRIVDLETGEHSLPPGEVGEIVVRGPQVMAGYWNAPEESEIVLRHGWIHTGDIGKVDENGNLYVVDRKKEMIKYKAFSIAPAELEAVLLEHPAVADCAVTACPDAEAGEVPHAHVVLQAGSQITTEEIQDFVRRQVAGYKQIRKIDLTEAIPRTPSGKILRRVLRDQQPSPNAGEQPT